MRLFTDSKCLNLVVYQLSDFIYFQGLNFSGADLSKLDLRFVNFKYANLTNTNLSGANLSNVNFERAEMTESILDVSDTNSAAINCMWLQEDNFFVGLSSFWKLENNSSY